MSGGIFGIGTSALLAYQRAMQVTGHNIANIGTEGYSRQRVDFATNTPMSAGYGSIGTGVHVDGVSRVVDRFVDMRLNGNLSAEAYERTFAEFAGAIDNLLGDPESGLTPALSRFFAAAQDVATDPTSTAARRSFLAEAEALVDRFAQLEGRINDQRAVVNGRIGATVNEINQIAEGIAELNQEIITAAGRNGGRPPNDLLDQREKLVRQLAERVSVDTLEQADGTLSVFIGRGQPLVVGTQKMTLAAQSLGGDPTRLEIGFRSGHHFASAGGSVGGGRLGALLELRDTLIDPSSNALGRVAIGVAALVNQTHQAGMDLAGHAGRPLFGLPTPEVLTSDTNAAAGQPQLSITDVSALGTTDYELRFDGTDWAVRRVADGSLAGTVAPGGTLAFDGLELDLAGISGETVGDRFVMRPLRVANGLEVLINDPREVAAALPVRAEAAAANAGGATVHGLEVVNAGHANLRTPLDVTFTGGSFVAGGVVTPLDPSGDTTIDVNGWRMVIRGTPDEGDVFSVRDNAGGVGDNRGALALAGLAERRLLAGGTATVGESYAEIVADVGVKTRRAQINAEVQGTLLADAQAQREAISGVNLDEEAANLLRFQHAYQAAAQVVAVAGTMFDSLLAAVRR